MKWQGRRGSSNIRDRRGSAGGIAIGGVGGVGVLVVLAIGYFLGIDVTPALEQATRQGGDGQISAEEQAAGEFVSVTLADTEEVWDAIFRQEFGQAYPEPVLVLFDGVTSSACGGASAATGPFYCPGDRQVYLDTNFFAVLERQLGAGGDFAQAYVVAHEVGHHVQNVLGILDAVGNGAGASGASVRIELQADCFAGIWARAAEARFGSLEPGDIDEALNAASRIGDDVLMREQGQAVRPESFTHGTAEQRRRWFGAGYESGDLDACDTFSATRL